MKFHFYRRCFMLALFLFLFQAISMMRSPLFAQTTVAVPAPSATSKPLPVGCGPKQVRYKVEVHFPNGRIHAIWTLLIDCDEPLGNGQSRRHLLNQLPIDVSNACISYGDFRIIESRAYFDGKSAYVRCSLPGMMDALKRLDIDLYKELQDCGCGLASEIWVAGKVDLSTTSQSAATQSSDYAYPVLVHDDLRFYLPIDGEGITYSHLYIQQERNQFTNPGQSFPFAQRLQWQSSKQQMEGAEENDLRFWVGDHVAGFVDLTDFQAWANFLDTTDYWQMVNEVRGTNQFGFVQWAKPIGEKAFSQSSSQTHFPVTTVPTTLYIGFDPVEQTYFSGSMTDIGFDPPPCKTK